jgi:very-short-patch-repair endonuclease
MYDQGARPDSAVAEIAARQHGVVLVAQLRGAGLDKHAVLHRVRTRRLHLVHRGVYAVGHAALSNRGRWMAAVLACGRTDSVIGGGLAEDDPASTTSGGRGTSTVLEHWGAALSHRSAAVLWELLPDRDGPIDVSIQGNGGKKEQRGIRAHRSLTLLPAAVTLRNGIPVTDVARTIADLRRMAITRGRPGLLSQRELRRAIRQAEVLGLPLGPHPDRDPTRSDLERGFLRLCRRHGLPAPEVNVRIGNHLVDFLWRDRCLVVEADGYRYHRGRAAFEDDRARDLELRGKGFTVIRLSEAQVDGDARRVAETLAAALRVGADAAQRRREA